jgi:microcystin-dependent protein
VSNPFVAEIRIFACNFAPQGWAFCNGQIMSISQNTALFSLLGTFYGGDGKSNFALPNLQGCAAMHQGQSSTGSIYDLGQTGGETTVSLLMSEAPQHTHSLQASTHTADLDNPSPQNALARSVPGLIYKQPAGANSPQPLANGILTPSGGSQPHNNMMPFLTLNFCIALQGVYPPRS